MPLCCQFLSDIPEKQIAGLVLSRSLFPCWKCLVPKADLFNQNLVSLVVIAIQLFVNFPFLTQVHAARDAQKLYSWTAAVQTQDFPTLRNAMREAEQGGARVLEVRCCLCMLYIIFLFSFLSCVCY